MTLTIGTKQDVDNMNPYSGVVLSAYEVWNMQYDYLTNLSADDMSPVPDLATSWERSDDGLTWTYHLRDDVKWSDGTPFTADDVVYTFTRTRDEEWSNFSIFTEGFTKVTAPDKNTVVITTSEPDPKLPNIPAYILPKHIFEKYGPKKIASFDNRNPVTTGPFRLTEWNKGTSFTMTANKNYFGGAPKVDTVRFRIFRNDESMAAALRNGEIDVIYDLVAAAGALHQGQQEHHRQQREGRQLQPAHDEHRLRADRQRAPGAGRRARAPGDRARRRQEHAREVGAEGAGFARASR